MQKKKTLQKQLHKNYKYKCIINTARQVDMPLKSINQSVLLFDVYCICRKTF